MRRKLSFLLMSLLLSLPLGGYARQPQPLDSRAQQSVRGDVDGSGVVDIDDVNAVINIMLHKNQDPTLETLADVDGNGSVDIDDLNIIINVMLGKDGGGSHEQGDWVDLGLPSGTLWATRNIGADKPEDYGDYFAWGETAPKAVYNWDTYKWYKKRVDAYGYPIGGYTKYCTQSNWGYDGFVDNKTELDVDDDAAAANWGGGARMPSLEQIKELVNNCTWQWTQRNGVNGQLGTGPNGNTIFLPAAGDRWFGSLYSAGNRGYYWSRTLRADDSDHACDLCVGSGSVGWSYYDRSDGHTVRAVRVP